MVDEARTPPMLPAHRTGQHVAYTEDSMDEVHLSTSDWMEATCPPEEYPASHVHVYRKRNGTSAFFRLKKVGAVVVPHRVGGSGWRGENGDDRNKRVRHGSEAVQKGRNMRDAGHSCKWNADVWIDEELEIEGSGRRCQMA